MFFQWLQMTSSCFLEQVKQQLVETCVPLPLSLILPESFPAPQRGTDPEQLCFHPFHSG